MSYEIENNIPIPSGRQGGLFDAMTKLQVGQSILIKDANRRHISVTMIRASVRVKGKLISRKMDGGIRVWRTE